jgi:hypothetical protein
LILILEEKYQIDSGLRRADIVEDSFGYLASAAVALIGFMVQVDIS